MKQKMSLWSILLCLLLCACAPQTEIPDISTPEIYLPTESAYSDTQSVSETEAETTGVTFSTETTNSAETTTILETQPVHSPLYMEGVSVEDVLLYFNEVCLASEYTYGGDSSVVQKWMQPIYYKVYGDATPEDMAVLADTVAQLNAIPGFPGMLDPVEEWATLLPIYFCDSAELVDRMGSDFSDESWGATRFWYEENRIYDAIICVRNDIDQTSRNSIIVEEIYNTLGPVQDTKYRTDSVIYEYSNENLKMSEMDVLLLKLLYHPDILCGMDADECEAVIRSLYY